MTANSNSPGGDDRELAEQVANLRRKRLQKMLAHYHDELVAAEAKRLQEVHQLPLNVAWLVASQGAAFIGGALP